MFPLRPFALLSKQKTPAETLTYWHRPHTSKSRLPVLFIHGIGIGLFPYVNFLREINGSDHEGDEEGDIGIIAIEIMPVSFRITGAALKKDRMCSEIFQILRHHDWNECILVCVPSKPSPEPDIEPQGMSQEKAILNQKS